MTEREKRMVEILRDLKENHSVDGIKAEFEAEGTRIDEAIRLKEVVTRAGLELTIKIGGCEAIKDMYDAKSIGVNKIIAPMIESAYALSKYISSIKKVFNEEERAEISFLVNIETIQGYQNFDEMLELDGIEYIDGIVLGRVDMTGSLNMDRNEINSDKIFDIAKTLFLKAKKKNLICTIGGGVAKEALPFFRNLPNNTLDFFETRKIIFKNPEALQNNPEEGILKAVGFELLWLKNKQSFYKNIYEEDNLRIEMLESRYDTMIEEAGGYVD